MPDIPMSIEACSQTTTTDRANYDADPINPAAPPDPYIERAKMRLGDACWDAVVAAAAVEAALAALVLPCDPGSTAARCSRSAARLLNAISRALYVSCAGDEATAHEAVVSLPAAAVRLTGDYLGVGESPDWISYAATMSELKEAAVAVAGDEQEKDEPEDGKPVASTSKVRSKAWSEIIGMGECARPRGAPSHLNWYLNTLKRYRPDMTATHGLRLEEGLVELAAFDPHGVTTSKVTFGRAIEPWIAHIVYLYDAIERRDTRFDYLGETADAARWKVQTDAGAKIVVEPFYSTYRTGKMTWAAFETRTRVGADGEPTYGDEAVGFFKISWQKKRVPQTGNSKGKGSTVPQPGAVRPRPPQHERQLLDIAHAKSWLPGLARHWTADASKIGPGISLPHPNGRRSRKLTKHSLHLASVGQPLSQCRSALHLLKVIYDGIQTHLELCKRGILHQDVSWHNILCNPVHDPAVLLSTPGKRVASVEEVPCIDFILTGDKTKEPTALLTDLDLSTTFALENGKPVVGDDLTVGTPMFIAVEVSSDLREEPLPNNHLYLRKDVLPKLREIESHPDLFKRAFPRGDNGFATTVAQIFKNEEKNENVGTTKPMTPHLPRHDVESLLWTLLWSHARACPVGCDPLDELEGELSSFVEAMMLHDFGEEKLRRRYYKASQFEHILHPKLAPRFAPLLQNMLRYLSVPWHRYDKIIGYYHAHIAMMRLLLPEIHALTMDPTLDVLFDTTQPRIRNLEIDNPWPEPGPSCKRIPFGEVTNVVAGNAESTANTLEDSDAGDAMVVDQVSAKRKRSSDDGEDGIARPKRPKLDAPPPMETTFRPSYKVSVLADLFRDTRMWMSRGDRESALEQPAQRARRGLVVNDTSEEA